MVRGSDGAPSDERVAKRITPSAEDAKKQRLLRLQETYSGCIARVEFDEEVFYTMDNYDQDFQLDDHDEMEELWWDDDENLWNDTPVGQVPKEPSWAVDQLACKLEIQRLVEMGVLVKKEDFNGPEGKLSAKFVFDWRVKDCKENVDGGVMQSRRRWMRRARFVAREFAFYTKSAMIPSRLLFNLLP